MKTRVTPILRDEARRYSLRFACEDCVHWVPSSPASPERGRHEDEGKCGEGWPERTPRDALERDAEFAFCKQFELA